MFKLFILCVITSPQRTKAVIISFQKNEFEIVFKNKIVWERKVMIIHIIFMLLIFDIFFVLVQSTLTLID